MNQKLVEKKTKYEEVYTNSKYPEKILQLIRFKKDPVEENNCYFRIIRRSTQAYNTESWFYKSEWEMNQALKKEGWVKIK